MPIKPYPQPNPESPKDYPSRFYQRNEDGTIGAQAVKPVVPQGEFEYTQKNGLITARFVVGKDLANGKEITKEGRAIAPYIPSEDIREIVRLAQILKRPVLIKGEPGSGKTQLSRALAYEWYGNDYQQHYFEWFVKSTTKASDGLYTFDHIRRLRDAQLAQTDPGLRNIPNSQYRKFGPMAQAFLTSTEENPSILLIDEIDKADIDFPNDLLLELDERRFKIPDSETGEVIEAGYPPVIFITSNDERELPEAFLRRCLFLYMKFPDDTQMRSIITAHLPRLVKSQELFAQKVVDSIKAPKGSVIKDFIDLANRQFRVLKDEREKDLVDNKRVSTSELIDWLAAFGHDWDNMTGMFEEAKDIIGKYVRAQISNDNSETSGTADLTEFENRSIGNYNFYSQTVLKTYAATREKEKGNIDKK